MKEVVVPRDVRREEEGKAKKSESKGVSNIRGT